MGGLHEQRADASREQWCAGAVRASTSMRAGCTSSVRVRRASSAWVRGRRACVDQRADGLHEQCVAASREQRMDARSRASSAWVRGRRACVDSRAGGLHEQYVGTSREKRVGARSRASSAWVHGRRARVDQYYGGLREKRVGASCEQRVGARAPCARRPACGRVARAACGRVVREAHGAVSSECGGGCAHGLAARRRCADGQIATAMRMVAQTGR